MKEAVQPGNIYIGNIVYNELTIQNLISVYNNDSLFNSLSKETKKNLLLVIKKYTEDSVKSLQESNIHTPDYVTHYRKKYLEK